MPFAAACGTAEQTIPRQEQFLSVLRGLQSARRSDPVAPADNPKSGNAFSTGTCPRRRNLDLETNRILAWTAIASRIAGLHARPGPLRSARGLAVAGAAVCARAPAFGAMMITAKATSFTGGFMVALPSPLGSAGAKRALVPSIVLYQGNRAQS
jgi:hypothetical protein